MPIALPTLDDRRYQQLLDEALARIPVHNPEWTNFNKSDPGVTLLELFAFLSENLIYRANLIPERNRKKFLQLVGVPLQPASSAKGICTIANERGALRTVTLGAGLEVRAGQVPFRTRRALDVLPVEAVAVYKARTDVEDDVRAYYDQLYASFKGAPAPADLQLYRTTPFSPRGTDAVDLGAAAVDQSLWIALLVRANDKGPIDELLQTVREQLAAKTLNLGIVPARDLAGSASAPGQGDTAAGLSTLRIQLPSLPAQGLLPDDPDSRDASYRTLLTVPSPSAPVVLSIPLPQTAQELSLWRNLDPLEAGARDFPPALDSDEQSARIITWIRVAASAPAKANLLWAGINAVEISQRARVVGELLPAGTGEPDQQAQLARRPVLPGTVSVHVTTDAGVQEWNEIDDLAAAGPEVAVRDPRDPPGTPAPPPREAKLFSLDAEAGAVRFGDGVHGARPPAGAVLRADYDYGAGQAGNVGPSAIKTAPALPAGLTVDNPLPTWGGADAESAQTGERQVSRYLQHRDRVVSAADFEAVAFRTPGVSVGRVDVLPAFNPLLSPNEPGDAPGAVTVLVLPTGPGSPPPAGAQDPFVDAVACWLAPRRLVTTELFVRRPTFVPVWATVGVDIVAGLSLPDVRANIESAIADFLSPLPAAGFDPLDPDASPNAPRGWPLRKAVAALELMFVVGRVPGVAWVNEVKLAQGAQPEDDRVPLVGIQLPRLVGIAVAQGVAPSMSDLRGTTAPAAQKKYVPVPVVPEECR